MYSPSRFSLRAFQAFFQYVSLCSSKRPSTCGDKEHRPDYLLLLQFQEIQGGYDVAMHILWRLACLMTITVQASGCASESVIPRELEGQLDTGITFNQIAQSPTSYGGKLVILGGEVLAATRLEGGTQLEVLELPLDHSQRPVGERTQSQGRFLAIDRAGFLDPATLTDGIPVTIVGEVAGQSTQRLDEADYTYLTIEVKHLKVWKRAPAYPGPPPGPRFGTGRGVRGGGDGVGSGF